MSVVDLCFGWRGRMRRSAFCAAITGMIIAALVVTMAASFLFAWLETSGMIAAPAGRTLPLGLIVVFGIIGVMVNWCTAAMVLKRMNDAAVPAWNRPLYFWVILTGGLVCTARVVLGVLGTKVGGGPTDMIILIMLGIAGGLPPERGANAHGPDPRDSDPDGALVSAELPSGGNIAVSATPQPHSRRTNGAASGFGRRRPA